MLGMINYYTRALTRAFNILPAWAPTFRRISNGTSQTGRLVRASCALKVARWTSWTCGKISGTAFSTICWTSAALAIISTIFASFDEYLDMKLIRHLRPNTYQRGKANRRILESVKLLLVCTQCNYRYSRHNHHNAMHTVCTRHRESSLSCSGTKILSGNLDDQF